MGKRIVTPLVAILALLGTLVPTVSAQATLPRPDHIVIVIEENKDYDQIVNSSNAPYLNSLIEQGALLTNSYGLHHPSQPNYIELFSGNGQGVFNDTCPAAKFSTASLGGSLLNSDFSFTGYAEGLPANPTICFQGQYGKKHCPWLDFKDVPASASRNFSSFPAGAAGFAKLPNVAFVIPNLIHDMHFVQTVSQDVPHQVRNGDAWLKSKLDAYVQWAKTHNSLLIITWDEDDAQYTYPQKPAQQITTTPPQNHIATILVGAMVKPGATSSQQYTHYDLLRTIEDMYGLPLLGGSGQAKDITGIWK